MISLRAVVAAGALAVMVAGCVQMGVKEKSLYERLFGDRDPVVSPGTATGTPGNWWTVFALVPDCFDHAVAGFAFRMRFRAQST